jgi:hypothetical protein
LQNFYHTYIVINNYEIVKSGLLDSYINLNNETIKRFCNKKKNVVLRHFIQYKNAFLYLFKGEIYKSLDICKDIGLLDSQDLNFHILPFMNNNEYEDLSIGKDYFTLNYENYSSPYENSYLVLLKDIFLIFDKFNCEIGDSFIKTLWHRNATKELSSIKQLSRKANDRGVKSEFVEMKQYMLNKMEGVINNPRETKNSKFHIPVGGYVYLFDKDYRYTVNYDEDVFIPMDNFMEIYYTDLCEKINSDLKRIGVLFS